MIQKFAIPSGGSTSSVQGSINISAGSTSSNVSAVTFSNANGVSFGYDGSNITATVATNYQSQGAYLTTAALSQDSSKYAGTGFTTATTAGTNVVGTQGNNGLSLGIPAYLTTAALSQDSSKYAGTGFTTATTAGTAIVGTLSNNGLSMGVPAYLTTAMQSNAGTISNINVSAGTTSNNLSAITFSNSNNVSFGLNGSTLTGSIATTYAGTGITTTTTAGTAVVGTLNTSGLSLGVPAYLTTADLSQNSSNYAGVGETVGTTAGTDLALTVNTAGVSIAYPKWITTAMQSNASTISNINVSAGTTSTNASAFTFSNLNNVTFGLGTGASAGVITASIPSQSAAQINVSAGTTSTNASAFTFSNANNVSFGLGTGASAGNITASIATTYAGTGFTSVTTVGTAILATNNTFGLGLAVPAFITTAALSGDTSKYVGTGFTTQTTAGTNIVGTANTAGVSMRIPLFITTAMASDAATISNINISAGTTSTNASAFTFANANNVSFGLGTGASAGSITASIATTYAGTGFTSATTAGTAVVGTLNTSGLSLGVPAYLTTAASSSAMRSYWANLPGPDNTTTTMCQSNTWYVFPLSIDGNISASYLRLLASFNFTSTTIATSAVNNATGASTAFQESVGFYAVLYTVGTGASSQSLQSVSSTYAGLTWAVSVSQASTSNASRQSISQAITYPSLGFTTATISTQYSVSATNGPISTTQWTNLSGLRYLDIPWQSSISAGNYWLGLNRFSLTTGGKNMDVNATSYGVTQINLTWADLNAATNVSNCAPQPGLGIWTTTIAQTTPSIAFSNMSAIFSYMIPMVQFIRQN